MTHQARVANLGTELVGARVDDYPEPPRVERVAYPRCVLGLLLADRDQCDLLRREPDREFAAHMLDVHAEKTLGGAQDRAMQHHGPMRGAVVADVLEVESIGQHVVDLDRTELPASTERVDHVKLELRTVECALALELFEFEAAVHENFFERR